jgi:hypothetical protein
MVVDEQSQYVSREPPETVSKPVSIHPSASQLSSSQLSPHIIGDTVLISEFIYRLYIDQPVQVGFSYDTLANGTFNTLSTSLLPVITDFSTGVPDQNDTFLVGTFPSLNSKSTANSTGNAAAAVWIFLQAWLSEYVNSTLILVDSDSSS